MMGIEIAAKPGPIPREMLIRFVCDGDHGMFKRADTFEGGGFIEKHSEAMTMGWKETYALAVTQTPLGPKVSLQRIFLCPECSGK